MSISRTSLVVMCGGLLIVAIVAVVSAQAGAPAAPARTQMDELLVEVRAIRADIDRASAASLRGQLLGMRLQLQEARITALSRQLTDVQDRLRANQQARVSLANSLTMFGGQGQKGESSPEMRKQMEFVMAPLKGQLELLDRTDADLKQEEASLMAQLQQEQNRWTAFNGQIEELERTAAGRAIR
jgi:chromosome segregation ATPase